MMYKKFSFLAILVFCLIFFCHIAMAEDRFIDNGDGTITDNELGLMWAKSDNQRDISWKDANIWAKYKFASRINTNYDNWRLPTLEELKSLYVVDAKYKGYITKCGFLVKIIPEIKLSCILIWTSENSSGPGVAFNFNIGNAFTIPSYDITGCRGLPVRTIK